MGVKQLKSIKIYGNGPFHPVLTPAFFMATADHFDPRQEAHQEVNGYCENHTVQNQRKVKFDPGLARAQSDELRDLLVSMGGYVFVQQGRPRLLDQVFKADPSISLLEPDLRAKGVRQHRLTTVFSRFYHHKRQPEVDDQKAMLRRYLQFSQASAPHVMIMSQFAHSPFPCEGSGDHIYDMYRDIFWGGFKFRKENSTFNPAQGRTSPQFLPWFSGYMNIKGVGLHVKGKFYHADTSTYPAPRGEVVCHPDGLRTWSFERLKYHAFKRFDLDPETNLMLADEKEADDMAPNIITFDENKLIVPVSDRKNSNRNVIRFLEKRRYEIRTINLSMFALAQGNAHCSENRVNLIRVPGGLHNRPNFFTELRLALTA
jgi:N-dimethylarginine dimethylaminohydrolase